MPIAGGGDWQCLSGQDPLPRRSPHLGTLRRVGWGAEGFGTFWLMEGPDATWPTSQSITACVEAGSRGSGGRNFSLGRHGSRCAPVSHACHLRWPNHLPKRACPIDCSSQQEAQRGRVGQCGEGRRYREVLTQAGAETY